MRHSALTTFTKRSSTSIFGPRSTFADTAYVNAFLLVNAQNQGIETGGPARFDTSWQARTKEPLI